VKISGEQYRIERGKVLSEVVSAIPIRFVAVLVTFAACSTPVDQPAPSSVAATVKATGTTRTSETTAPARFGSVVAIADLEAAFRQLVNDHGLRVQDIDAASALDLMTEFFDTTDVTGLAPDAPGDMLLFQTGTYDWGQGPSFQYDLTRQLIAAEPPDQGDDAFWQLSLTLHYEPTSETAALASETLWAEPAELTSFVNHVASSDAYAYARDAVPIRVEIHYSQV
jgi:hypothetical protein